MPYITHVTGSYVKISEIWSHPIASIVLGRHTTTTTTVRHVDEGHTYTSLDYINDKIN